MALGKINFYPLKKQWTHETTFSDRLARMDWGIKKVGLSGPKVE